MSDDLQELPPIRITAQDLEDPNLPSGRVPHMGHALLFLVVAVVLLLVSQLVFLLPGQVRGAHTDVLHINPKLVLASEAVAYLLTLSIAWFVFPALWKRSFLEGINWNPAAVARNWYKLIPMGLVTGWTVEGISSLIKMPKQIPMDEFFKSPSVVWMVTIFGTLLAPAFEEILFRGFLLPAFAIAADWLGPMLWRRTPLLMQDGENLGHGPTFFSNFRETRGAALVDGTGNLAFRSMTAVVVASLLSSGLFGLLHAAQLGWSWGAVVLLSGVSLVLTGVRVRTRSVACSALVHASYNLSVFLLLFVATGGYRHLERMAR